MLWHLVWELEGVLRHVGHGLQRIEAATGNHRLSRGYHSHVDILLLRSLDLLLLLLQQFNLLLDGKLLHCREVKLACIPIVDESMRVDWGGSEITRPC